MSVLPAPQHCLATFKLLWLSKKSSVYLEGKIFQPGNDNDAADEGPHFCHLPFRPLFELAPWPRQEQLIILLCLSRFIFPQLHTSLAPQSDSLSNIYSSIRNPLLILLWEPLPENVPGAGYNTQERWPAAESCRQVAEPDPGAAPGQACSSYYPHCSSILPSRFSSKIND